MPGHNHYPNCSCGWCRGGNWGGVRSRTAYSCLPAAGTKTSWACDDFCHPTRCPRCRSLVYFVRHNGGSVWFDELGPPWPKHACFFDDLGGVRLRIRLSERVEGVRTFFGVVTETTVTEPGLSGRIVVRCSDGRVIDDEFQTTSNLTTYPGSLVVVEESEQERYVLDRIQPDANVIEVWHCPQFEQPIVYDPRRQHGLDELDSRFWLCGDRRWTNLRDFHVWRSVEAVDGLAAAKLIAEYLDQAPTPRGGSLFERLVDIARGHRPPKGIEVTVFAGTLYARVFKLPSTLNADQIAEWVRQCEKALRPRRPETQPPAAQNGDSS